MTDPIRSRFCVPWRRIMLDVRFRQLPAPKRTVRYRPLVAATLYDRNGSTSVGCGRKPMSAPCTSRPYNGPSASGSALALCPSLDICRQTNSTSASGVAYRSLTTPVHPRSSTTMRPSQAFDVERFSYINLPPEASDDDVGQPLGSTRQVLP
jgi:hypothetical protein